MKLRRFVLRGVERNAKISQKKKRKKPSSKKRKSLFYSRQLNSSKDLVPIQKESEVIPELEKPSVQLLPVEQKSLPGFTLTDLIRPNEKVKSSIEGFFLDQRSEHTRRAYSKDLKRFIKYLLVRREDRGNEMLQRTAIIGYKDWLQREGLEDTSVDRHLATLRSLFNWLIEDGVLEKNPADKVRFIKPKRISTTVGLSDDEVRKILAIPDLHTKVGAQHYAILMVLFYCGLRRSELCSLKKSNLAVEREQPILKLRGKGNSERIIPLIRPVWNAIQYSLLISRRDGEKKDAPLFEPSRNNRGGKKTKHLDTTTIYYIVQKYAKLAGIQKKISPHSCRATAISNARDHQVSDRAIQEFAGWASPDMITRYDKRKTSIEDSAAHAIFYGGEGARGPDQWLKRFEPDQRAEPDPEPTA